MPLTKEQRLINKKDWENANWHRRKIYKQKYYLKNKIKIKARRKFLREFKKAMALKQLERAKAQSLDSLLSPVI